MSSKLLSKQLAERFWSVHDLAKSHVQCLHAGTLARSTQEQRQRLSQAASFRKELAKASHDLRAVLNDPNHPDHVGVPAPAGSAFASTEEVAVMLEGILEAVERYLEMPPIFNRRTAARGAQRLLELGRALDLATFYRHGPTVRNEEEKTDAE